MQLAPQKIKDDWEKSDVKLSSEEIRMNRISSSFSSSWKWMQIIQPETEKLSLFCYV